MHVRVRLFGKADAIIVVKSKLTKIEEFRKLVRDKFDVEAKNQQLFYGGKLLENGYTFHDYNVKLNDVIQLMVNEGPIKDEGDKRESDKNAEIKNMFKDASSKMYAVGDLVDARDKEGMWYEATVSKIVYDPQYTGSQDSITSNNQESSDHKGVNDSSASLIKLIEDLDTDIGLLYFVHYDYFDETNDSPLELENIRPRSRNIISIDDLKEGQIVMINHNIDCDTQKGQWYDFTVIKKKNTKHGYELFGSLHLDDNITLDKQIRVLDKIYAIEKPVPLSKRTQEYEKLMLIVPEKRSEGVVCLTCLDVEEKPCKDCGCTVCSGKEMPEKILLCDECNDGYHMFCLNPPVSKIPDDDWYCPSCKRDSSEVIAPGGAKQTKKINVTKRDWGRGMACVGRTKSSKMPPNHIGAIPGIEVGTLWKYRIQLSESGVHRPPVSGIHGGGGNEGCAYSIVLSGGYEDDVDNGEEFIYTGSGGRDLDGNKRTAQQSYDQQLTRQNRALARNCAVKEICEEGANAGEQWREGRPVRVVRSYKMLKHFPQYAPKEGVRYDGIYKVVKYYPETGKSGFLVWKYLLRRDDPSPAPWEPNVKKFEVIYPAGYLEAEAEKKLLKQKVVKTKRRPLEPKQNSDECDLPSPRKTRKVTTRGKQNETLRMTVKCKTPPSPTLSGPSKAGSIAKHQIEDLLTQKEIAAIKSDTVNTKLWDQCMQTCRDNGKQRFIEQVTEMFLCIICQDMVCGPVTTACQHNFCMACIKSSFKFNGCHNCPCCRNDLSEDSIEHNENLKAALQTIMPGYDAGKQ